MGRGNDGRMEKKKWVCIKEINKKRGLGWWRL
jgi:hypothetical protein